MVKITMTPTVDAGDMPDAVEEWCIAHEISVHYASEIHWIQDDGNPLAEWLKGLGYDFLEHKGWVGVHGT